MAGDLDVSSPPGWGATRRQATVCLAGLFVLSVALRWALAREVRAPFIFLDELGYSRLALSLAHHQGLSLFGLSGLSYPPLYPAMLAPIYALHASGVTAFAAIKVVNVLAMSCAVFPAYGIARSVLPRRPALAVAGLSICTPVMYYTTFPLSENLTFPLGLAALWAMLATTRAPSVRRDALLLVAVGAATAARIQMIALFPAALTAIAVVALAGGGGTRAAAVRMLRHRLLVAVAAAGVVVAGLVELAGHSVFNAAGRYANVGTVAAPSPWHVVKYLGYEVVELSVALGYVPFAGALVAAYLFFRRRPRGDALVFAAVALAASTWLMLEVAYVDAEFAGLVDFERIHERYLIYLFPLFLTAFVAAARSAVAVRSVRTWGVAALVAGAIPAVIPFGTFINNTIVLDTFSLDFFARISRAQVVPLQHPVTAILVVGLALGAMGVVVRQNLTVLVGLTVVISLLFTAAVRVRVLSAANGSARLLTHQNWVDRADPHGQVILLSSPGLRREVALQTVFFNLSISRLDAVCRKLVEPNEGDFGERVVTIDATGGVRLDGRPVRADYVVASTRLPLAGVVRAREKKAHAVLVATGDGFVRLRAGASAPSCTG